MKKYEFVTLPGRNNELSGSALGGYNLAINNYISNERKNASVIAFKYITSLEMQKKVLMKYRFFSAIPSLYEDPDVCSIIKCKVFKKAQLIARPTSIANDYSYYSERFRNYIYDYLYGSKSPEKALEDIDNITKIHTITLNIKESFIGLFNVIVITFFSVLMLISCIFLFKNRFKHYFKFLSNDSWIFIIVGSILMMHSLYSEIGEIQTLKCHMKTFFFTTGFTLNFVPILHRLVVNFPEKNKFSNWAYHNKYLFIFIFILINVLLQGLYMIAPYKIESITSIDGTKYNNCIYKNTFSKISTFIMIISRILFYIIAILLIFIEWNLVETYMELKYLLSAITTDIICDIIILILINSNIRKDNYIAYYSIYSIVIIIYSLSNYLFLYAIKIIIAIINFYEKRDTIFEISASIKNSIKEMNKNTISHDNSKFSKSRGINSDINSTGSNSNISSASSIYQKVIGYHNKGSNEDIHYESK